MTKYNKQKYIKTKISPDKFQIQTNVLRIKTVTALIISYRISGGR